MNYSNIAAVMYAEKLEIHHKKIMIRNIARLRVKY